MTRPRRRASDAHPLLIPLDPDDERPLYRQVYEGLREAILERRLGPGTRLPSSRALAGDLGVSRHTVMQAFEQLGLEGYTVGRRGGGTRVERTLPEAMLEVGRPKRPKESSDIQDASPKPAISARGVAIANAGAPFLGRAGRVPIPFELGVPPLDAFPYHTWARLAGRRLRRGAIALAEADPAGLPALREAIADYLVSARAARCTPDRVLVVNGAQQALDLAARVLLDPGDAAWIEDPGYFGARMAIEAAGARLVPVPVDEEGLDVAFGERLEPRARLAYVTPSHQFPLGPVMTAARRLALLDWARRANAWVIEDDYDSEFRFEGRPLPCLQGLEAECSGERDPSRVLYVGTFAKSIAPALRLGYLVVPERLVDVFRAARIAIDRHSPTIDQAVLADFIEEGHYARHLRRVRVLTAERQTVLIETARQSLEGLLTVEPDPAGLHVVGRLREGIDDTAAARAAHAAGVAVSALSSYTIRPGSSIGALLLGYAGFEPARIRHGVDRLRTTLQSLDD